MTYSKKDGDIFQPPITIFVSIINYSIIPIIRKHKLFIQLVFLLLIISRDPSKLNQKVSRSFSPENGIIFSPVIPLVSAFPNLKLSVSEVWTLRWLFSSIPLKFPISRGSFVTLTLTISIPKASLDWGTMGRLGMGLRFGFRGWIRACACTDNSLLRRNEVRSRAKRRKRSRITMWIWAMRYGLSERNFPRFFIRSSASISIGLNLGKYIRLLLHICFCFELNVTSINLAKELFTAYLCVMAKRKENKFWIWSC